ncbi:hypothetical protein BURPS1655_0459 [Burkholderia pseudomallei 1655]|nr:hypothetical protein BURPS1655_0459 [Burkholderia pseudomallei 1655]
MLRDGARAAHQSADSAGEFASGRPARLGGARRAASGRSVALRAGACSKRRRPAGVLAPAVKRVMAAMRGCDGRPRCVTLRRARLARSQRAAVLFGRDAGAPCAGASAAPALCAAWRVPDGASRIAVRPAFGVRRRGAVRRWRSAML